MARNEEKQHGRLNRLWLQKEKEEGHLKEVYSKRPRLSALHKASDVKKWIPSIKNEIEYYLEQSQLTHYSDRKIQEFQEKIESLKKEYQSFLWKLRRLDPTCKDHPWKQRGYSRKRTADGSASDSGEHGGTRLLCTPILDSVKNDVSDSEEDTCCVGEDKDPTSGCTNVHLQVQDKPLEFNIKKSRPKDLWLRSSYNSSESCTNRLKEILLSHHQDQQGHTMSAERQESRTEASSSNTVKGILGLDCYSSSDEDN
ncbi:uncharacterized protein LOC128641075 [Bombina bombina]|uniref:uncharacterized protein LOC128641075 n=1 Tax=Bombina bombina TaxID=8345 RepID=UPI00235A5D55|nr:uncharacterized protein LOC128641075 [Bombina bombina]